MKRVALAILGVIVAVALLVAIARQTPEKTTATAATSPPPSASTAAATTSRVEADPSDVQLDVREILLADGGADRTSVRIDHPDPGMQQRLREFLEPREQAALTKDTPLDCHAQVAKRSLVSLTCVTMVPALGDAGTVRSGASAGADGEVAAAPAGNAAAPTEAHYESLTLRFSSGQVKPLALADVLSPDAGPPDVVEACKRAADPDLACDWPPTDFAIIPGGTLFVCHDSHCVDIDQTDAPNLLRPEYR